MFITTCLPVIENIIDFVPYTEEETSWVINVRNVCKAWRDTFDNPNHVDHRKRHDARVLRIPFLHKGLLQSHDFLSLMRHPYFSVAEKTLIFPRLDWEEEAKKLVQANPFNSDFPPNIFQYRAIKKNRKLWISDLSIRKILERRNFFIVMAVPNRLGYPFQAAPDGSKDDLEIALVVVQKKGKDLQFASIRLRDDPKIVMAAVQQDGLALKYASDRLKNDSKIVLAAVRQNGFAVKYAAKSLDNDPNIGLEAVKFLRSCASRDRVFWMNNMFAGD